MFNSKYCFKALHDIGPVYWWDYFPQRASRSNKVGLSPGSSLKGYHLMRLWRHIFSIAAPALCNSLLSEIQGLPSVLAFWETIKTWVFVKALSYLGDWVRRPIVWLVYSGAWWEWLFNFYWIVFIGCWEPLMITMWDVSHINSLNKPEWKDY